MLLYDLPKLLEWLNISLVLINLRVLSGRLVEVDFHIVYFLHLKVKVNKLRVDVCDLSIVLILVTLCIILTEALKLLLDFVEALLEDFLLQNNLIFDVIAILL